MTSTTKPACRTTSRHVDRQASRALATDVGARSKHCFRNAFDGQGRLAGALYVEGWVVADHLPVPVEHAWLELDGRIIDPTPSYHDGDHEFVYFAGVRYERTAVALRILKLESAGGATLPLACAEDGTGLSVPDYRAAYIAAVRHHMEPDMAAQLLEPLADRYPDARTA